MFDFQQSLSTPTLTVNVVTYKAGVHLGNPQLRYRIWVHAYVGRKYSILWLTRPVFSRTCESIELLQHTLSLLTIVWWWKLKHQLVCFWMYIHCCQFRLFLHCDWPEVYILSGHSFGGIEIAGWWRSTFVCSWRLVHASRECSQNHPFSHSENGTSTLCVYAAPLKEIVHWKTTVTGTKAQRLCMQWIWVENGSPYTFKCIYSHNNLQEWKGVHRSTTETCWGQLADIFVFCHTARRGTSAGRHCFI